MLTAKDEWWAEETNSEARSRKILRDKSIFSQTQEGLFTDSQKDRLAFHSASWLTRWFTLRHLIMIARILQF